MSDGERSRPQRRPGQASTADTPSFVATGHSVQSHSYSVQSHSYSVQSHSYSVQSHSYSVQS
ncbi:MAG: hypothetical protein WBQ44_20645, partial [Rhodococcus sp. (in: high G+C Gram-positive bacteria)]